MPMSGLAPSGRVREIERPAPHAGMNTHDSVATSMNKITAPMRTALSEFQGMRVPFKTMRAPVHFANYTRYDVAANWVYARSHPEKAAALPCSVMPGLASAGVDAWTIAIPYPPSAPLQTRRLR